MTFGFERDDPSVSIESVRPGGKNYPLRQRGLRMDEDMLADQRRLVELIEAEGWDVTDVELSAYESPWVESNDPEATVTLTARKVYGDEPNEDNPFRVS